MPLSCCAEVTQKKRNQSRKVLQQTCSHLFLFTPNIQQVISTISPATQTESAFTSPPQTEAMITILPFRFSVLVFLPVSLGDGVGNNVKNSPKSFTVRYIVMSWFMQPPSLGNITCLKANTVAPT